MGRRASRHRFAPGQYVFPGGQVDAADHRAPFLTPLRPAVEKRLRADCARGQAFAVAAVRETYEETGLLLGEIGRGRLLAALHPLDYVLRAITPSASPIRYHARFFVADASAARGRLKSNGELLDLAWRPVAESLCLPTVDVTRFILGRIADGFGRETRVPLFCFYGGRSRLITRA